MGRKGQPTHRRRCRPIRQECLLAVRLHARGTHQHRHRHGRDAGELHANAYHANAVGMRGFPCYCQNTRVMRRQISNATTLCDSGVKRASTASTRCVSSTAAIAPRGAAAHAVSSRGSFLLQIYASNATTLATARRWVQVLFAVEVSTYRASYGRPPDLAAWPREPALPVYLALPAYACAASLRCAARPILCTASLYPRCATGYPLRRHSLRCAASLSCASPAYLPPSQLVGEGPRLVLVTSFRVLVTSFFLQHCITSFRKKCCSATLLRTPK